MPDISDFVYAEETRNLYVMNETRGELSMMTLKIDNSEEFEGEKVDCVATGSRLLVWPEKDMIFIGGKDIRVFEMKTLRKIATLKTEGEVLILRLTPKKNKLFVLTDEAYHTFNIKSIVR